MTMETQHQYSGIRSRILILGFVYDGICTTVKKNTCSGSKFQPHHLGRRNTTCIEALLFFLLKTIPHIDFISTD